MYEKELEATVSRIKRMEKLFDFVTEALQSRTAEVRSASVNEAVRILSDYYESGEWLHDYELDEQRSLPPTLKRGVLSQDSLYELLSEIKAIDPSFKLI